MPPRGQQRALRGSSAKAKERESSLQQLEPTVVGGNDTAHASVWDSVGEARMVEAVLASRTVLAEGKNAFASYSTWIAVVALEVVVFIWLAMAMDVYSMYRGAKQ